MSKEPTQTADWPTDLTPPAEPWHARLWDTPRNGARYYVFREQRTYAEDARGNVWIGSKKEAERLAERLNQGAITHG